MTMTPIATICHGADDPHNADHRRLTLLIDTATGRVYARESEDAEPEYVEVDGLDQVATSYEGASWDLEWLIDPWDVDDHGRPLGLPPTMQRDGGTFALIGRDGMIREVAVHESDRAATRWFARRGHTLKCSLVILDLDSAETPQVGDYVRVDNDGVATLVGEPAGHVEETSR